MSGLVAGCKAPVRSKVGTLQARATPQTAPRPGNPKGRSSPTRHSSLRSWRVHMHTRRRAPRLARRQGPSRPRNEGQQALATPPKTVAAHTRLRPPRGPCTCRRCRIDATAANTCSMQALSRMALSHLKSRRSSPEEAGPIVIPINEKSSWQLQRKLPLPQRRRPSRPQHPPPRKLQPPPPSPWPRLLH